MNNINYSSKIETVYGEGIEYYQKRIKETIIKSLNVHARTALIRLDLRFPTEDIEYKNDSGVITRFFKYLNERFLAYQVKRAKIGVRVHRSELRYFWVKEFSKRGEKHYHIVLLVNHDTIYRISVQQDKGNFYTTVADSWLSALRIKELRYRYLVHVPDNCVYSIRKRELDTDGIDSLYLTIGKRLDYLIKIRTKNHEDGERNFGCSQR